MIKRKALALAISAVVGGAMASAAYADSAFFPQVVYSPTVTTIVSVVNTSGRNYTPAGAPDGDNLHYRLYYKDLLSPTVATDKCEEVNVFRPTSKFDLQTFDIGNVTTDPADNVLGVLFNDPSVNNDWKKANLTYALGTLTGLEAFRGYLVVDNAERDNDKTLTGEAVVLDFVNGSSWGYSALDRAGETDEDVVGGEFDYGLNGERSASRSPYQTAIMPFAEVNTAFLVTPIYDRDQGSARFRAPRWRFASDRVIGNVAPDSHNGYKATLRLDTDATGRFALFDRDEVVVSGTVPREVVCVGRVEAQSLLTAGALASLPNGGWGNLRNFTTVCQTTAFGGAPGNQICERIEPAAVVIKHEAGTSLNGFLTGAGRWNNAIILPADEYIWEREVMPAMAP